MGHFLSIPLSIPFSMCWIPPCACVHARWDLSTKSTCNKSLSDQVKPLWAATSSTEQNLQLTAIITIKWVGGPRCSPAVATSPTPQQCHKTKTDQKPSWRSLRNVTILTAFSFGLWLWSETLAHFLSISFTMWAAELFDKSSVYWARCSIWYSINSLSIILS